MRASRLVTSCWRGFERGLGLREIGRGLGEVGGDLGKIIGEIEQRLLLVIQVLLEGRRFLPLGIEVRTGLEQTIGETPERVRVLPLLFGGLIADDDQRNHQPQADDDQTNDANSVLHSIIQHAQRAANCKLSITLD